MGEKMDKLPAWARKVLVVVAIVGPVCGATATVWKTISEIKSARAVANQAKVKATKTQVKADDGYKTVGPAIKELQTVLNVAQEWAAQTDVDLDDYGDRLARCEDYMEKLSRRRGFPELPELEEEGDEEGPWYETPIASVMPALPTSAKPKKPEVVKAMRPIPDSLNKASSYQQQRVKEHCAPDDPMCGAAAGL